MMCRHLIALLLCSACTFIMACNRRPASPTVVEFIFDAPFEGERIVRHAEGSVNPVRVGTALRIDLQVNGVNTYDASRWPDLFKTTAHFADGSPIEAGSKNDDAKFGLQVVGWDGDRNMIVRMKRK